MSETSSHSTDIRCWLINILPTKEEVTSLIGIDSLPSSVLETHNEMSLGDVSVVQTSKSPIWSKYSPVKLLVLVTSGIAAGYCGVILYKKFQANYTHITVIETVNLPNETTESFVHIGMPLSGEIQFNCNMLSHCKFLMKLNTSLKPEITGSNKSVTRVKRVVEDIMENSTTSLNTNHTNDTEWTNIPAGDIAKPKVSVTDVVMNNICDIWTSEKTGKLHFAPSSQTDSIILMRYNSCSHESFQAPVAVKECMVQPASAPNVHRLSFEVCIVGPALDVAINIIFPKGAQVLSINHNHKGHWRPVGACAPNEIVWHLGTFASADKDSSYTGSTDNLGGSRRIGVFFEKSKLSQMRSLGRSFWCGLKGMGKPSTDVRNVRFDPIHGDSIMSIGHVNAASSDFDHTSQPAPVELMAMDQMLALGGRSPMVYIPFEALYTIPADITMSDSIPQSNRSNGTSRRTENGSTQCTHIQNEEPEACHSPQDDPTLSECTSFNPNINIPAICLAYSTNVSTSGILVRNFKTVEEEPNYNLCEDLLGHPHMLSTYAVHIDDAELTPKQRIIKKCIIYGFHAYDLVNKILKDAYSRTRSVVTNEVRQEDTREADWERRQKIVEAVNRRAAANNHGRNVVTEYPGAQELTCGMSDMCSDPEDLSRNAKDRENISGVYQGQVGVYSKIESPCTEYEDEQKVVLNTQTEKNPPPVLTRKLAKKVRYLTHFIQQVPVVPSY